MEWLFWEVFNELVYLMDFCEMVVKYICGCIVLEWFDLIEVFVDWYGVKDLIVWNMVIEELWVMVSWFL